MIFENEIEKLQTEIIFLRKENSELREQIEYLTRENAEKRGQETNEEIHNKS